jgi:polyphosphate kinase
MWKDNRQAWDLKSDGSYTQRTPPSPEEELATHRRLMDMYREGGRITP